MHYFVRTSLESRVLTQNRTRDDLSIKLWQFKHKPWFTSR